MRVTDKRIELLPPQLNARKIWLDGLFTRDRYARLITFRALSDAEPIAAKAKKAIRA